MVDDGDALVQVVAVEIEVQRIATLRLVKAGEGLGQCGVAIHLSADVPSPAVGFGMVWLPWPIKISIGPLSPIWVAGMAFLALRFALSLCGIAIGKLIGIAVMFALAYSALHEQAIVPLVVFGMVLAGVLWGRRRRERRG